MKAAIAIVAAGALSAGTLACSGNTRRRTAPPNPNTVAPTTTARTGASPLPLDRDNDYEHSNPKDYYDADDYDRPYYPYRAGPADTRAVAKLVKRYIAAAAVDDGATACSLLYSLFAEAVPETYGPQPPIAGSRGKTCPEALSTLFRQDHKELATEAASVQVRSVWVGGLRGRALLHFRTLPARSIAVHREHGAWKIDNALDAEVS